MSNSGESRIEIETVLMHRAKNITRYWKSYFVKNMNLKIRVSLILEKHVFLVELDPSMCPDQMQTKSSWYMVIYDLSCPHWFGN